MGFAQHWPNHLGAGNSLPSEPTTLYFYLQLIDARKHMSPCLPVGPPHQIPATFPWSPIKLLNCSPGESSTSTGITPFSWAKALISGRACNSSKAPGRWCLVAKISIALTTFFDFKGFPVSPMSDSQMVKSVICFLIHLMVPASQVLVNQICVYNCSTVLYIGDQDAKSFCHKHKARNFSMVFLHHLQPFGPHKTWQCNQSVFHLTRSSPIVSVITVITSDNCLQYFLITGGTGLTYHRFFCRMNFKRLLWWIKCTFMMANLFWSQRGEKCRDWPPSKK